MLPPRNPPRPHFPSTYAVQKPQRSHFASRLRIEPSTVPISHYGFDSKPPAPPSTSRDCGADISTWFRFGPIKVPVIRHGSDSKTLRPRLPPASTVLRCALLDFSCKPASPRRALPVFSCRLPCTSPDSLQGLNFVQGKRGSARQIVLRARFSACTSAVLLQTVVHFARFLARVRADAGIRGKCTASCKKSGEMHARPSSSWGSWRIFG